MNSEDLERADVFKTRKYAEMCDRISRTLGPPWAGTVITFTVGVRGSVQTKIWEQNLEAIGVHKAGIEKVINLASKSALEQCHFMYQAREAALKLAGRNSDDPKTSG